MATAPEEAKAAQLDAAAALVRRRLDAGQAPAVERFLRRYYEHVAPEDLAGRTEDDLYGAALAHWNLARVRQPGEILVRAYVPSVDEHGWECGHAVAETVTDDMPFLVDSVAMEVTRQGRAVHLLVRPIVRIARDADGQIVDVEGDEGRPESLIHVELDRRGDPEALEELRAGLARILEDVHAAVADWPAMRERMLAAATELADRPPPVAPDEVREACDLLRWLHDDHFTFLGYREFAIAREDGEDVLRGVPGSGLGVLRETGGADVSASFAELPPELRRIARERTPLTLTKASSRATVHRPAYLDYVGVKRFDEHGEVTGERRFLGLYTHTAYRANPWEIPVLRRKAHRILDRSGLPPGGHDHKALAEILETHPRDELFQAGEHELYEIALGIFRLGERPRLRLFCRRDRFGRFVTCLVFLPRDRFHTENRRKIEEILLEAFGGVGADYTTRVSDSVLARLEFVVRLPPGGAPEVDVSALEARLAGATRAWRDDLRVAFEAELGEDLAGPLFARYGDAFPGSYMDDFRARQAVHDANRIEALDPDGDLGMTLYLPLEAEPGVLRLKLLRTGGPMLLSDVLPVLENMGVRVVDERPYEVRPEGRGPVWIYDFGLQHAEGAEFQADRVREVFADAFVRAWRGEIENDGFNALVLSAQLTAREIEVLRAIAKYLRQAGTTFSQAYMEAALAAHPLVARRLVELFRLRLDPERYADTDTKAAALERETEAAIDEVASLDEDRILRGFLRVVRATLRTNWFRTGPDGRSRPYLALKLDPQLLPELPEPRPLYEVFVCSPRVEAVHLRGGKVARGGIRWSDRREDFRTEILGLMKAQTVKNAVIVPVGAKGGFVVKRPPAGGPREALLEEVVACYRDFMRGLLDLTDTTREGQIVPPPQVVRHDEDDPYLVVAADKGTATFSDVANAISTDEYDFWLGDAFASGGSTGYDHKAMGITARGAWESVKRHFRELGVDVEREEVTAVGIGDMSGDVFGNGMLLSRRLKLVGAFDHRHVFLDPNPDPGKSYGERKRLFELPASSWADYDETLISPGGGVFPRSAKAIPLSREARAALDVTAETATPTEVIRALLRAPVDLLWNGGIGTYVKADAERHGEVGDKANDAVRVDAGELRCRVVGEGGNLGFTQLARVEYALGGGRIFMDAIDNSAGVDCSDHEVNIKILLDGIVRAGDLTPKQRNALLAEMTDELAALVLRDNYDQAQALATSLAQAASMAEVHERYLRSLEADGTLSRELEFLPGDEALAERRGAGGGLTAPELAILLSYTKTALADELLASTLPDEPFFAADLERYFPTLVRHRCVQEIADHPLRREIVASRVANELVNRAGTTFAFRLGDETGAGAGDVARAYVAARDIFGLAGIWAEIEALDGAVPAEVQVSMTFAARTLLERASRWLLRNRQRRLDVEATVARFAPGASELAAAVPGLLEAGEGEAAQAWAASLAGAGVPPPVAERVAHLEALVPVPDLVELAAASGLDVVSAATVYFALGARLELHWLRDRIVALPRGTRWEAMARAALRDDVYAEHAALAGTVVATCGDGDPRERVETWLESHAGAAERCLRVLGEIRSGGGLDLARLSVGVRELRNLIASSGVSERSEERVV